MSYSLCFKKGEVEILSLGVSHSLSQAFITKPTEDEWKPMTLADFSDARDQLFQIEKSINDDIDFYNRMFNAATTWDDRANALNLLKDFEKDKADIEKARIMLDMLEMIFMEGMYSDIQKNIGLDWGIF